MLRFPWKARVISPNPNVKRITVLRQLGGVGDMIMATPVFRGLKELYGQRCRVTVGTSWQYYAGALPLLLRHNPHVDEVIRVEPYEFVPSFLRKYRWDFSNVPNDNPPCCVLDTDLVIDLNTICSVTESAQMPLVTLTRSEIWCRAAGVQPSSMKPVLMLTEEEKAFGVKWADEQLGEGVRVGVVLKAHDQNRTWPHAEELAFVLHRAGYRVGTIDMTRRVSDHIPAIMGMDIRHLAAIIAQLDAVVTPDTGLLHLAGTVGTPVLALFGPTDGEIRMREYAGHYVVTKRVVDCGPCWYGHQCLRSTDRREHLLCHHRITVDLVVNELERMLDRFGVAPP